MWLPLPSFTHKFFRDTKIVKPQNIPLRKVSALWDKKFWWINLILPPSPHYQQTFSITEFGETLKISPTKNFSFMRQKVFDGKSWYSFPLTSIIKLLPTPEFFWTTAEKGSSMKCFGTVRENNFDRKSWFPASSFIPNIFRYTKLLKP